MSALLTMILPAIMPALTDGFRGVIAKITGNAGGNPQNINERVQLMQAETERLKALAEIDKPSGETSQWVTDARAIYRYAFITMVLFLTGIALFAPGTQIPVEIKLILLDLSGACGSFIIGERMYFHLKTDVK